jgi:RNA-binding protein YhbY
MDTEFIKAKGRLNTIIFRKEGGSIKVTLSQMSLDLLGDSPEALTGKQCTQEMWDLLCQRLDQHGLVNHRVVKDASARREMIHEIVEAALGRGVIETITRRSWMTFTLSRLASRDEKSALVAREGRLAAKRTQKAA